MKVVEKQLMCHDDKNDESMQWFCLDIDYIHMYILGNILQSFTKEMTVKYATWILYIFFLCLDKLPAPYITSWKAELSF